jgi:hypothetical protein
LRKPEARAPFHGTQEGDKVSGDKLHIECRKPDRQWRSFMMSGNHNGFWITARKNATATVEQGYKNVRD